VVSRGPADAARKPERTVHVGDGVAWLQSAELGEHDAIVTSLPDHSEVPALGVPGWAAWFEDVVALACSRTHPNAVSVFYQTDVKHEGRWIDKAALVHAGARRSAVSCLWHKIVCRVPPGHTTFGRPAYAHLLCFSRELRVDPGRSTPDVIPVPGQMSWARAMPSAACEAVCRFLLQQTPCRRVIDPFCGHGSILVAANAAGMDAVGVELSAKRAKRARESGGASP